MISSVSSIQVSDDAEYVDLGGLEPLREFLLEEMQQGRFKPFSLRGLR